jgi:hypothetical protein
MKPKPFVALNHFTVPIAMRRTSFYRCASADRPRGTTGIWTAWRHPAVRRHGKANQERLVT